MSFLKNIFKSKDEPVRSYSDFWNWFQKNEKEFFNVVKGKQDIEKKFFARLSPKLAELKEGFFYVTGMDDDHTAELILTADGIAKNVVFVEELVAAAPEMNCWKFTALKPSLDIENVNIAMGGYKFDAENLSFYSNELPGYPDEIDITIVHRDLTEENKKELINGVYIFLDNYLGELDFLNNIDNLNIAGKKEAQQPLIPIEKLKDFLMWRQKEFIEKYEGVRYDTESDSYSILEATLESGFPLVAVINTELLQWDSKASHPWMAILTTKYDGSNNNGLPGNDDYQLMNEMEDEIMTELKDNEGYLNVGRETAKGERNIYFACKDFRKPSKVFFNIQKKYAKHFKMEMDIYKDKYWRSVEKFNSQ